MPKSRSPNDGTNISQQKGVTNDEDKQYNVNTILEKDILLSLNEDIALVRDKKDILNIIHPKLKTLFNTDDIFICILDHHKKTLNPILRVAGERRQNHVGFQNLMHSNLPIHDGFI